MKIKPGIIAVHKPKGPTSHDIIDQVRKLSGIKKVGHAGTLDPLASGVLVVAIGREYTKQLSSIVKKEKVYLATIKLGETSETHDSEGPISKVVITHKPSLKEINKALVVFTGKISQIPPIYSAIKIKGTPTYKKARAGESPKLKARRVLIKDIKLISYKWPILKLKVTTGPGVYVRALARDLGKKLKTGAYLAELERTRVGKYSKKDTLLLQAYT